MKLLRTFCGFVTGLSLWLVISSIFIGNYSERSLAVTEPSSPVPTITWQNTQLPDWNQITFSSLPGIIESGSFLAPSGVSEQLGYDPSRTWVAGQKPAQYMKLGDFQDSFKLQQFNQESIGEIVGLNLDEINLSSFGVMQFQTLESLVQAIPALKNLPITEVKPIFDLLSQELATQFDSTQTIGQLLQQSPHLGQLEFANLPMDSYNLDAIPGLDSTPIAAFKDWQSVNIDKIPGLGDVPFSQFPNPANPVGADVGIVDIAFGTDEQQRERTISGSNKQGFNVPCEKDCAHIELSGSPLVLGKQWISGKYQLVRGGKGILASVNGGKEPTGRHPFGDAFKVVVWDTSEVDGMVTQALFFRACMRKGFVDLGCTPYFIGPIPWLTYKEKEPIFLGLVTSASNNSVSIPTGKKSSGFSFKNPVNTTTKAPTLSSSGNCSKQYKGVAIDALSDALSEIEGNYDFVGAYVCNGLYCGRGLGTKQFMSYRSDVRSLISSKSGGQEFLALVDKGQAVSGEEMMMYFPPAEQQATFESDITKLLEKASQQIDPTTGQPFTKKRLIERVAQMHFGGAGIPIDAAASEVHGLFSVKDYGEKAAANYTQALQSMGCF
ncbi:hypothetical protein NIES4075_68670 [Tolypothrix sp. NIES-4075]|uniref:hypothetical protein n=1 Tax=Tolypothrix sp. NIES-4075 TaxID=2005459 RepID=UPI000B5C2AE1|nr:hypothetical protein [Tolypothrix sp. NIES-4075]GAX45846.1 hypothetical protein NIES4075_68670 [Tolypothrix sp. NIES-4075]